MKKILFLIAFLFSVCGAFAEKQEEYIDGFISETDKNLSCYFYKVSENGFYAYNVIVRKDINPKKTEILIFSVDKEEAYSLYEYFIDTSDSMFDIFTTYKEKAESEYSVLSSTSEIQDGIFYKTTVYLNK